MTLLSVSPRLAAEIEDFVVYALVAHGLQSRPPWPDVAHGLEDIEGEVAADDFLPADEHDPRIAIWHEAYRRFGTNPRRQRPSCDALCRRLTRTGRLPRINPPVDAYNLVSVSHAIPVGAFDLAAVDDIELRHAVADEQFVPLGEPESPESPRAGEVIYADRAGVLTRHWNHRDADRTKLTTATERAVFLLEMPSRSVGADALELAVDDLRDILLDHATTVDVHTLDAEHPRVELDSPGSYRDA